MIDINKKYRTRDGREVKLFTTELKDDNYKVLGIVKEDDGWEDETWTIDGRSAAFNPNNPYDLIEINEQEELLEEARRRYPVGTKYIPINKMPDIIAEVDQDPEFIPCGIKAAGPGMGMIYENSGQWAEVVKEHTVEVYLYKDESGDIDILSTRLQSLNLIAKKQITFYEGEGL